MVHGADRPGYEVTSELGRWLKSKGTIKQKMSESDKYWQINKIWLLWWRGRVETAGLDSVARESSLGWKGSSWELVEEEEAVILDIWKKGGSGKWNSKGKGPCIPEGQRVTAVVKVDGGEEGQGRFRECAGIGAPLLRRSRNVYTSGREMRMVELLYGLGTPEGLAQTCSARHHLVHRKGCDC